MDALPNAALPNAAAQPTLLPAPAAPPACSLAGAWGKPCFLVSDDGSSHLSRLADEMEAVQLEMGTEILDHARAVLGTPCPRTARCGTPGSGSPSASAMPYGSPSHAGCACRTYLRRTRSRTSTRRTRTPRRRVRTGLADFRGRTPRRVAPPRAPEHPFRPCSLFPGVRPERVRLPLLPDRPGLSYRAGRMETR
ncbi:hypothetical protein NKH18_21475 [Streptomyces sp. M10(2022)]